MVKSFQTASSESAQSSAELLFSTTPGRDAIRFLPFHARYVPTGVWQKGRVIEVLAGLGSARVTLRLIDWWIS
jgi:hypothetical protein